MKLIQFGNEIENNERVRYRLSVIKYDRTTDESVDDTMTIVYSNDLKTLKSLRSLLCEVAQNRPHYLDIKIFDYQACVYIKQEKEVK